jgi:branched-chain amino acid transport system substrate-binding protein
MAIDDFGGKVNGKPIQLLQADNLNKADVALAKGREWFDTQQMDMLVGGTNSAAALALAKLAQEKKKPFIVNGSGSSALTNEQCNPYTIHYAWDSVALAKGTAAALTKQGAKNWFLLVADYAFGHAMQADAAKVIDANGGKLVGVARHPINLSDYSSFLLQAQNAKPQVLGFVNAGGDFANALKGAREFGLDKSMKMASLVLFISDVHGLGLAQTQGLQFTTSWDWSLNDESRAFGRKFFAKTKRMPTDVQASNYSATMQYLKAVEATKSTDGDKIMTYLKSTPLKDFYASGNIRPDGRYVHDMYLMQVKTPAESTQPWDYVKRLATLKGDEVFTTKAESKCALWK